MHFIPFLEGRPQGHSRKPRRARSCLPTGATLVEGGETDTDKERITKVLFKLQFPCLLPRLTASESLGADVGSLYLTRLFKCSLKFKKFSLVLLGEESERETPTSFLLCSLSQSVGPGGWTARNLSKSAGQLTIRRG